MEYGQTLWGHNCPGQISTAVPQYYWRLSYPNKTLYDLPRTCLMVWCHRLSHSWRLQQNSSTVGCRLSVVLLLSCISMFGLFSNLQFSGLQRSAENGDGVWDPVLIRGWSTRLRAEYFARSVRLDQPFWALWQLIWNIWYSAACYSQRVGPLSPRLTDSPRTLHQCHMNSVGERQKTGKRKWFL